MSELPKGWKMGTLRDLARVRNGYAFKSSDFIDEGVPLIRQSNLVGDTVEIEKAKCLPPSFLDELPRFTVKKGDVLIGMSGSIGKLSWYRHDTPALQNQRTGLLEFEEPSSAGWVCYFLNSVERQLNQTAKGVAVQNISGKEIEALSLPLPPLPEQRRIVARIEELFSRLDAGVAALRQAKAQLQRYRQSVLAAAVTGQLTQAWREQYPSIESAEELLKRILEQRREQWDGKGKYRDALGPDSPSELPEIPANWIWTTLDSLCISKVGNAFKSAQFKNAGVRLLRGENIEPGALRWANTRYWPESNIAEFQDLLVDQGDVIIAMDRPLISSGLKVAVAKKEDTPCLLVQRVTRLRPIDPITSRFIFTNINTKRFVDQLIGNQTGTQIPHITEKGIRCFAIPLPPLAEQQQIVAEVESRTTAIDHLEAELDRQITRSNRLRQSTLASAFAGHLQ